MRQRNNRGRNEELKLAWAANEFSNVAMSMHFWWTTKIDDNPEMAVW